MLNHQIAKLNVLPIFLYVYGILIIIGSLLWQVVSYESVTGCDLGLGREERETARGVEPGGTKAPVTEQMLISKKV